MNPTTSQEALSQLNGFTSTRKNPLDVLKESQTRLGVNNAQQRVQGLRGAVANTEELLRGVDPSVSGRTAGSLVTDAQRQRLVAMERAPLDESFRVQQSALSDENANANTLNNNALTEAQLAISQDDQKQNALKGIYEMLFGQETAAENKRRYEQDRADQLAREAAAAAASRAAAASQYTGLSGLLGGAGASSVGSTAPGVDANSGEAYTMAKNYVTTLKTPAAIDNTIRSLQAMNTPKSNAILQAMYALDAQNGAFGYRFAPRPANSSSWKNIAARYGR